MLFGTCERTETTLTCRASVHPRQAPLSKPWEAFTQVLTENERKQPWSIYTQPGLLVAKLLEELLVPLLIVLLKVPSGSRGKKGLVSTFSRSRGSVDGLAATVVTAFKFALVIAVFEVLETVFARLAVQVWVQPKPKPYVGEIDASSSVPDKEAATSGAMVQLHPCEKPMVYFALPYKGVFSCIGKVRREEGFLSFIRGVSCQLLVEALFLPFS